MYVLLFAGVVSGLGLGALHRRRETPSVRSVVLRPTRPPSRTTMVGFGIFVAISTDAMPATPFRLEGY